jgi:hypothetical protein
MMQHNEEWIKINRPTIEMIQTQLLEWLSYSLCLCPTGLGSLCKTDQNNLESELEEVFQGTENDWSSWTAEWNGSGQSREWQRHRTPI